MKNDVLKSANSAHKIWHKFSSWLERTYGKDLITKKKLNIPGNHGQVKQISYNTIDELELSKRLVGYDVIVRVERYVKRYCPEIKIIHCDDDSYSSSIILLVPHPGHGISVIFIPQCVSIQNRFFLYQNHYKALIKGLKQIQNVYNR